jgi:DNA-binding beta-propeller fold protein YncE
MLGDEIDRIFVTLNVGGTVIDCNVTTLSAPDSCRIQPDLLGVEGKLALEESNTLLFGARRYDNRVAVFDLTNNTPVGEITTGVSVRGLAVDPQTGIAYMSNWLQENAELFAIDPSGAVSTSDLSAAIATPGQVEVDETNGRIYIVSTNSTGGAAGIAPLIALYLASGALAATLEPAEWVYFFPGLLGVDKGRNLLYISTSSNRLVLLDGARLSGNTSVSHAHLWEVVVGQEDGTEGAQGVVVDAARNLIYVTRFSNVNRGGDPARNALVVLQGPDFDVATRTLRRPPQVVAEIPNIGLNYGGGRREIALDLDRNLIYVGGLFGGSPQVTVLDGSKIVDAQGQVTPNPAEALLGIIPIRALPSGETSDIPIDPNLLYNVAEIAFTAAEGLLYVVAKANAPFTEGFLAVINSRRVIDGDRHFIRTPHPEEPETWISLIATIPAGVDPQFVTVDTRRNRVLVTNQSLGALSVLRGLSVTVP